MVETEDKVEELIPARVGDRLRAARVAANLDLADVASRTRVPLRHLDAIERGDYAALPAAMYCVGFVKAYARAVGEDEVQVGKMLRDEMGTPSAAERHDYFDAETIDPERFPTRKLALTALALAVLVFAGYAIWRSMSLSPDAPAIATPADAGDASAPAKSAAAPAPAAPNPNGQVVLTATDTVWLSIKDEAGASLLFREMKAGETFTVPPEAVKPRILTGRPEKLKVTVDGKEVAPLGPPERTVKDLEISAKALLARQPVAASVPSAATPPAPAAARP